MAKPKKKKARGRVTRTGDACPKKSPKKGQGFGT